MSNTLFNFNITINKGLISIKTSNILIGTLPYIKKFHYDQIMIKYEASCYD